MSHSQFHSIKLFTLRHAWLNLWDKHMTTGRINQITIVQRKLGHAEFDLRHTPQSINQETRSLEVLFLSSSKLSFEMDESVQQKVCFWIRSSSHVPADKLQGAAELKPKFATSWWAFLSAKQSKQLGFSVSKWKKLWNVATERVGFNARLEVRF